LFELTGLAEIDAIRNEVNYWTNYAMNKQKDRINEKVTNNNLKFVSNATTIVPTIKNVTNSNPVSHNITNNVTNIKKSRVIESNRRLQSLADMKRSNPSVSNTTATSASDFTLSPQIIYNNYKQGGPGKSKRSSI